MTQFGNALLIISAIWQLECRGAILSDTHVRLLGPKCAIVTARQTQFGLVPGQPNILNDYSVSVRHLNSALVLNREQIVPTGGFDSFSQTANGVSELALAPLRISAQAQPIASEKSNTGSESGEKIWTIHHMYDVLWGFVVGALIGYLTPSNGLHEPPRLEQP